MHDRTMFCLVDACTVRSSPKLSIMIPKMTLCIYLSIYLSINLSIDLYLSRCMIIPCSALWMRAQCGLTRG